MAHKSADSMREAITCVIPIFNPGKELEKALPAWADALSRLGRSYEILLVNDGSTDDTATAAAKLQERVPHLRVLAHETRRGYGASLRTALAEARHPLFFHTAIDSAYVPGDLRKLLERVDIKDEVTGQSAVLVSGCRTGGKRPFGWRVLGGSWRLFCRVVLGLPLEASPVWLGFRELAYSYFVWIVFSDPLADPKSAFKLWRTEFLKRVPLQSDSDFVHVELVAKATFLTCVLDEVPLSPALVTTPPAPSTAADFWRVLRNPDFGVPPGIELRSPKPPVASPAPVSEPPVEPGSDSTPPASLVFSPAS